MALKWNLCDLLKIEAPTATQPGCSCSHPWLKDMVLSGPLKGCTTLLMACEEGNLDAVKMMVETWGVDVNATALYYIEPVLAVDDPAALKTNESSCVKGASPLFVAALAGHSDIVRYLLAKGANVSLKTIATKTLEDSFYHLEKDLVFGGLTPLHASVASKVPTAEQTEIIRLLLAAGADPLEVTSANSFPIWRLRSCGLDAIAALLEHSRPNLKMSLVTQRGSYNQTILHYWASGRMEERNSNYSISLAVVKLLLENGANLQARDDLGYTPILRSADHRIDPVLNYLLKRDDVERLAKVDALELAGAATLLYERNVPRAFEYWREATILRQKNTDGCRPIPKLLTMLNNVRPISVNVEWSTLTHLEELQSQPLRHYIQSLLTMFRIHSSMSWLAVVAYLIEYTESNEYDANEWTIVTHLERNWLFLESILYFNPREDHVWGVTVRFIEVVVERLSEYFEGSLLLSCSEMELSCLNTSLKLIVLTNQSHFPEADRNEVSIESFTGCLLQFFSILARLPEDEIETMMPSISSLVRQEGPNHSMLLSACKLPTAPNTLAIVRLLLRAGANPYAVDSNGNSPRHLLAVTGNDAIHPIGILLNDAACLNGINKKKNTAAQLWMSARGDGEDETDLPDWLREKVPTLKLLAERAVRRHQIDYFRKLPQSLYPPLMLHH